MRLQSWIRYKFSDYAMFNQQRKGSLKWHQDRMYWLERLKKLPEAPILPQDGRAADKCENTYEFYRFQKHINQSDWKRIKEIAVEYGVTVSSVLIGIYAEVISRWSSNKHFTLNLPIQNRPRDEYGTLSINVEEEVNIPSCVTIGNVMLPSVKETFEQIWPDAVKKALEILFKQNRTEKMSMAQYQIYVSKLWSEICQKVGYMNIVDYDNFGDIKSIFYDLEKRHLIKKENDGIE